MELTAGKVAVVTGTASGIGLALAERFAQAGLDVVLADAEPPALQAAEQKVAGLGAKTLAVPTDVSDEAAVKPSRTVPALSPAHHMRGSPGAEHSFVVCAKRDGECRSGRSAH
jgi:NADP-dependent 3-hydroxy acid dehydrogenase YdfG